MIYILPASSVPRRCISGVLVANKVDLDDRRVISPKAGKQLAEANALEYFEVSAVRLVLLVFYKSSNQFIICIHFISELSSKNL